MPQKKPLCRRDSQTDLVASSLAPPGHAGAGWLPVVGTMFAAMTLLFFMGLVIAGLFDHPILPSGRFLVVVVLALGAALSGSFLGGAAAVQGDVPFPFAKSHPITFAVRGGVAVFIIVLLLGHYLYVKDADKPELGITYDRPRPTAPNEFEKIKESKAEAFATASGVDRADLRLGPFPADIDIWLEATNTAEKAFSGGIVGVRIRAGDEQLGERQANGEGTVSCSVTAKVHVRANKELRFQAIGWNWHASSKQVMFKAYRAED